MALPDGIAWSDAGRKAGQVEATTVTSETEGRNCQGLIQLSHLPGVQLAAPLTGWGWKVSDIVHVSLQRSVVMTANTCCASFTG